MAASTVSSSVITDRLASPPTYVENGELGRNKSRTIHGTIAIATTSTDETADKIMLFPIDASESLLSLKLFCDDLDTNACPTLAVDVGLYKDVGTDGTSDTEVDVDAYASAITNLQAAVTTGIEVAYEARNINKMGQTVAVDGGETLATIGDSVRYVGLKVTTVSATPVAGDLSWIATISSR